MRAEPTYSPNREIELKLEIAPRALKRLMSDGSLFNGSDCRTERQVSTYYDTADFRLRKKGYSLRVRSIGDRFIQTLKPLANGAGMFRRSEWESEIAGPGPDLDQLANTPAARLDLNELRSVVQSEVDRTICRLGRGSGEVELDADIGTLSASAREIALSELEIEVLGCEPRAAMELAQSIAAGVPVKLGVLSKAERGFALADGTLLEPTKSQPVVVRREMTVAQGFETIVTACLRHFRLNEPIVTSFREVEAMHQARVAMRRLRSALALFRPAVEDDEYARIKEELRWFSAELGDARALDVYLDRGLSEDQRHFVQKRREQAYDLATAAMDSPRFSKLMLDISCWAADGKWKQDAPAAQPLPPFVNHRIDRFWSKIVGSHKVARMDDRQRHRLRIRLKKLRYALEFVAAIETRSAQRKKRFTRTIKNLQDVLGDMHDNVTARSLTTLNSWLVAPGPSRKERRLVGKADRELKHLRAIGPYWG